ncbi:unnamed protein product [Hymenolepis diminuta]|uniref:Uncharacterized protein n=1 Tax=Hymenolepis diminuta TaxID=6216 RepID=A0A564YLX1_HYMDI|nr:unnamed protein product [Hymenolepis diminuta]
MGENPGRFTIPYFQGTQPLIVHIHAQRRILQPAQQFMCVIIIRMVHGQRVS